MVELAWMTAKSGIQYDSQKEGTRIFVKHMEQNLYLTLSQRVFNQVFYAKNAWVLRNVLYVAEGLSVVFEKAAAADADEQLILSDR